MDAGIVITPLQEAVLVAYLETGSQETVYKTLNGVTYSQVHRSLMELQVLGVLTTRPDRRKGYHYSGVPYMIGTGTALERKDEENPLPVFVSIEMTENERQWMQEKYIRYRRRRRKAAAILGRSVYELNLMAIALDLDRG